MYCEYLNYNCFFVLSRGVDLLQHIGFNLLHGSQIRIHQLRHFDLLFPAQPIDSLLILPLIIIDPRMQLPLPLHLLFLCRFAGGRSCGIF